jgi:tetratricopeptide (TPR) repeat protein
LGLSGMKAHVVAAVTLTWLLAAAGAQAVPMGGSMGSDPLERGADLLAKGQVKEAVALLSELVRANEKLVRGHYLLARAYMAAGRPKDALISAGEVVRLAPNNVEGHVLAGSIFAEISLAAEKRPDKLEMGDQAIAEFKRALAQEPDNISVIRQLMIVRTALVGVDVARRTVLRDSVGELERALAKSQDPLTVHYYLGQAYRNCAAMMFTEQERRTAEPSAIQEQSDLYERALEHYETSKTAEQDFYVTLWEAADARTRSGHPDEAVQSVRQHLDRAPSQSVKASFYSVLAVVLQSQGRLDEAREAYESSIAADDRHYEAYLKLAEMDASTNAHDRAIATLTRAIDLEPKLLNACRYLGKLYWDMQDYQNSERYYRLGLAIDPKQAVVVGREMQHDELARNLRFNCAQELARMLLERRSWDKAVAAARLAREMQPDSAQAYLLLGRTCSRAMRLEEARRSLQRAIELDPNLTEARRELAQVWMSEIDRLTVKRDLNEKEARARDEAVSRALEQDAEILKRSPDDLEQAFWLANQYRRATNFRFRPANEDSYRALELLDAILKAQPNAISALVTHAMVDEQMGRYDDAIKNLERALAIPAEQGIVFADTPDPAARDRVRLDPATRESIRREAVLGAKAQLAWIYAARIDKLDEGEKLAREVQQASGDLPFVQAAALDTIGYVLYEKGDAKGAIEQLRNGIRLAQPPPRMLYHLGLALFENKEYEEAERTLDTTVRQYTRFLEREDARKLITKCKAMIAQTHNK